MKRIPLAVFAVLLLALGCTEPSSPGVGGVWQYASSLTFPSDFDIAPGQPYVCTYRAVLTLGQSHGTFSGSYDSLSIACNTGATSSGFSGAVINGAVTGSGAVGFDFDAPSWSMAGTVRGDSRGGIVSGPWSACLNRACR
jgi:hypothetical protein